MELELISLIGKSEDFEILAAELVKRGYIKEACSNRRGLVNLVRQIHHSYVYRTDLSHYLPPLPGRIVNKNGVEFFIHGLVHRTLGYSLTEEYKNAVREAAEGWKLLCEDGFKDDIFPDADIFGEVEAFGINKPRNIIASLPRLGAHLLSMTHNKLRGMHPQIDLKDIKTIDDLRQARIELFGRYLPEPLGMSAILYVNPDSLRVKRYVFEAEEAMRYSSEKGLSELHLIVGCAHELPLEHLLSNPDKIGNFKRD